MTPLQQQVLVVDDDPAIRAVLQALLDDAGYGVAVASNGREALDLLHDAPASVVILDLDMPVLDGRSAFRAMRASGLQVPVIILSAQDARGAARELGAYCGVNKPFDIDDLLATVERLGEDAATG